MRTFRPSLKTMLILAFIVISIAPVAVMTTWLNTGIHNGVMKEAHDKNQLLSENMANPVYLYLKAAQRNLNLLANILEKTRDQVAINETITSQAYFENLVLVAPDGTAQGFDGYKATPEYVHFLQKNHVIQSMLSRHVAGNSGMVLNPQTNKPALFFVHPVGQNMLVGSLRLAPIESLAAAIHFGKLGHCAITDQFGNIVHHPNPKWMSGVKNISNWPIVQAGLQGKRGVMTFYSPFIKADMIAGYAAVPEFNWVILTPQPLSELTAEAKILIHGSLLFGAVGLVISVLLAIFMANWIVKPINVLAEGIERIRKNDYSGKFIPLGRTAPQEIETLRNYSIHMVDSIREAVAARDELNRQLENRIRQATQELTDANKKLSIHAHVDELTNLKNRRALWERLSDLNKLNPESYMPMQVMLFDVDQFKQINDSYGHDVGDYILTQVAREIEKHTRDKDFVVRYGGDEFLVVMPGCTPDNAYRRAEAIRASITSSPLIVSGHTVPVTLSIGIADQTAIETSASFSEMLKAADTAMYQSKENGRNRISFNKV
ncbi:diguanylate cyclase/phosphodiesterase (GGDEF & EAL domains) with PAS/PAC sensor(s) [Sulfuriferula multivorans]|uniref:diguanylate cyclase n=1 Tax=Sulfuriferula multivorans TaxID=1559896 RepID=A0A401JZX3_9PROT|nr:diguanylate cyclase [Sulfuriferula multivorans]GCB02259.1 diguanylate cyclase/phosphodiesterase (GGDEF & EAL domains) with PAS/PAC sensor(s) [Sulfuriferula multivorans]